MLEFPNIPVISRYMLSFCDFGMHFDLENLKRKPDLNTYVCLNWILKKNLKCELWYYCYQHPFSSVPFLFLCLKIYHLTTEKYTKNPGKLDKASKTFLLAILLMNLRPKMQLKSISCLVGDKALGQVCLSLEARLQVTRIPEKRSCMFCLHFRFLYINFALPSKYQDLTWISETHRKISS